MEAAAIEESHVAPLALTGSPVIGVFQTLLTGKAEQLVPGSLVPEVVVRGWSAARREVASAAFIGVTTLNNTVSVATPAATIAHEGLGRDMDDVQ